MWKSNLIIQHINQYERVYAVYIFHVPLITKKHISQSAFLFYSSTISKTTLGPLKNKSLKRKIRFNPYVLEKKTTVTALRAKIMERFIWHTYFEGFKKWRTGHTLQMGEKTETCDWTVHFSSPHFNYFWKDMHVQTWVYVCRHCSNMT